MIRAAAMVSVIFAIALVSSCGSDAPAGAPGVSYTDPGVIIVANDLQVADRSLLEVTSSAKRITYISRSAINEHTTHVTGSVFVPKGNPPPGGWPIVAFGHPTTGTSPDCAPSVSPTQLDSATVEKMLGSGYLVTVPDYQGFANIETDNPYHPYLDSTTAGYNVIDSVRAARKLVPDTSDRWAALGTSQGGQAAWAANELDQNYGRGLKLLGTASLSPISDINGLADAAAAGTLTKGQQLALQAFLAALQNEYDGDFHIDDYRRGVVQTYWDVLSACQGPVLQERAQVADQITADDLRPANPKATEVLRCYLHKTSLPQGPTAAPMLVIYSGKDSLIPPAWTEGALDRACRMGDVIQIQLQPEQDHDQIDPSTAFDWLGERFKDLPAQNDCGSFTLTHESHE
jgi:Secretory lipase